MKSKKKTLLSAVLAIVLCMSLIAGSTFALFTSESKVNIAVTSGKVEVNAEINGLTLYSATTENTDSVAGTIASGNHAGTYYYESVSPNFTNGGTAVLSDENGTLTLDRVTPGDKVNFNVGIANESNVNIKYRVLVTVTSGLKLFNALKVKIDGTSLTGVSRTGAWTSLAANGNISDIPVEIYLPIEAGNEYQNLSTAMIISVEAVQSNAKTVDGALTAEVAAVAEEKTEVNTATNETAAATTISDNDNLVTVSIPATTKLTAAVVESADENDELSLAVKVKPQDTVSNIAILSTQASASYDVSVLLVVNGEIDETKHAIENDENNEITVSMFIGAGLTGVKLYHGVEEITYDNYNSETGYITFKTTSFSEYTVVYNADYAKETFDEQGKSTGIVVYEATETAGVYTTTDEQGEEVYVTVNEDAQGNVTESTGDIVVVTSSGISTAYETLTEAVNAARSGDTVTLLNDITVTEYYSSSYVINSLRSGVILDGNSHTITIEDNSVNRRFFRNCYGKIQNITFKDVNEAIVYYAYNGTGFENVTVTGDISVDGNCGGFVIYSHNCTELRFVNCIADINMTGTGTSADYNAPFVGYAGGTTYFTNCVNKGNIICGSAGMFVGNPSYYSNKIVIENCYNNGLIQRTYVEEGPYRKNNILVGVTSDFACAFAIDGVDYTMNQACNHELDDKIGGTGSYIVGSTGITPVLTLNDDGTFTFTAMEGAAYYVVSIGLYTSRNEGGSNRNYVTETIVDNGSESYISAIRDLKFVDSIWVESNEDAEETTFTYSETEYKVYTLNGESYYLINNTEKENLHGNIHSAELYSVSVYDSEGKLLGSSAVSK